MTSEQYAALNTKLDRMMELVQQEFQRQREELAEFRAQVNARFDDVYARFDDVYARLDDVNRRLDDANRRLAYLRVEKRLAA